MVSAFLVKSRNGHWGVALVAIPEDMVETVTASLDLEGQLQVLYDKRSSSAIAAVQLAASALPMVLCPSGRCDEEDGLISYVLQCSTAARTLKQRRTSCHEGTDGSSEALSSAPIISLHSVRSQSRSCAGGP